MFNPYVGSLPQTLRPVPQKASGGNGLGAIFSKLGDLDRDDLLMLLLIYLLVKEGDQDGIWPLVAAALYLLG